MKHFIFSSLGKDKAGKDRAQFGCVMKFDALQAADNGERVLAGAAIVYGQLSDDRGSYKVKIAPGAATFADPTLAFLNHNSDALLGNTINDTLKFQDSAEGVGVEITLPKTVDGDKAWTWVKDKYANGMSFGCWPLEWEDAETAEDPEKGTPYSCIRTYTKMLVDEVTITHSPAFTSTTINVASGDKPADKPADDTPADDTPTDPASDDYAADKLKLIQFRLRRQEKSLV